MASYRRFMGYLEHWANHGVPQMFGSIIAIIAIGLGISMFAVPQSYLDTEVFTGAFAFASPHAWGTYYFVAGTAVLITVYANARSAQAPLFMLAGAFSMQGLLTLPQISGGEVPQPIILLMGLTALSIATQLVCGVAKEKDVAQTSVHYIP
jgi:hypothetical protein